MLKRILFVVFGLIPVLGTLYFVGPRPEREDLSVEIPEIPLRGQNLEEWVNDRERAERSLKKDNEARIVWYDDSLKSKTEFAVVYLHGFSASQGEGTPVHREFARRYGCNLYLARLTGHGSADVDAMGQATPRALMESAAEAVGIGKALGEKVIVMSTSTGSTLALPLAARYSDIHSLIMFSPNIRLADSRSSVIAGPWGERLAKMMAGGEYVFWGYEDSNDSLYWSKEYPVRALVNLQVLLEQTMQTSTFEDIVQPVFLGYYYKNEEEQDPVVSVEAMLDMYSKLSTPDESRRKVAFPDAGRHVIAGEYKSQDIEGVQREIYLFAEETLGLAPVEGVVPQN